jgi:hypothetical protein
MYSENCSTLICVLKFSWPLSSVKFFWADGRVKCFKLTNISKTNSISVIRVLMMETQIGDLLESIDLAMGLKSFVVR